MSSDARRPKVLHRYENAEQARVFRQHFADVCHIVACDSDAEALSTLATARAGPFAAIVLSSDHELAEDALELLETARALQPRALRVLIHKGVALDPLVRWIDQQLLDNCFELPRDAPNLQSRILTSALGVQSVPVNTPAGSKSHDGPLKVLIVDDEPAATRYLIKQLAPRCDCELVSAADGREALDCLTASPDRFAAIISDHRMPGISGSALLADLRRSHPDVVRVLTSAWGEVDVALEALNDGGIFQYLKKPWDVEEVRQCIDEALIEHRELSKQAEETQSNVRQQHERVLQKRYQALFAQLAPRLERVLGDYAALETFWQFLNQVEVLPPSPSSIRASLDSDLEETLIRRMGASLESWLTAMTPWQPISQGQWAMALGDYIQSRSTPSPRTPSEETGGGLATLCAILDTLLASAGLVPADLELATDTRLRLHTRANSPLRLYQHLAAPLTTASTPLIQQQSALLALMAMARGIGLKLALIPHRQRYSLSLEWPAP